MIGIHHHLEDINPSHRLHHLDHIEDLPFLIGDIGFQDHLTPSIDPLETSTTLEEVVIVVEILEATETIETGRIQMIDIDIEMIMIAGMKEIDRADDPDIKPHQC